MYGLTETCSHSTLNVKEAFHPEITVNIYLEGGLCHKITVFVTTFARGVQMLPHRGKGDRSVDW